MIYFSSRDATRRDHDAIFAGRTSDGRRIIGQNAIVSDNNPMACQQGPQYHEVGIVDLAVRERGAWFLQFTSGLAQADAQLGKDFDLGNSSCCQKREPGCRQQMSDRRWGFAAWTIFAPAADSQTGAWAFFGHHAGWQAFDPFLHHYCIATRWDRRTRKDAKHASCDAGIASSIPGGDATQDRQLPRANPGHVRQVAARRHPSQRC